MGDRGMGLGTGVSGTPKSYFGQGGSVFCIMHIEFVSKNVAI